MGQVSVRRGAIPPGRDWHELVDYALVRRAPEGGVDVTLTFLLYRGVNLEMNLEVNF